MKTSKTVVGVDTAKQVFQLHWVDMEAGESVDLKLTRSTICRTASSLNSGLYLRLLIGTSSYAPNIARKCPPDRGHSSRRRGQCSNGS